MAGLHLPRSHKICFHCCATLDQSLSINLNHLFFTPKRLYTTRLLAALLLFLYGNNSHYPSSPRHYSSCWIMKENTQQPAFLLLLLPLSGWVPLRYPPPLPFKWGSKHLPPKGSSSFPSWPRARTMPGWKSWRCTRRCTGDAPFASSWTNSPVPPTQDGTVGFHCIHALFHLPNSHTDWT